MTANTSLRSYRVDSDDNFTIDNNEPNNQDEKTSPEGEAERQIQQSLQPEIDYTPAKIDLIDSTVNKKTSSTEKRLKIFKSTCGWSGITATSYSPRETGVRIEKSFTAIIPPTTPCSSLCRTPKGLLERLHLHGDKQNSTNTQLSFATPLKNVEGTNKHGIVQHSKSSMKIFDLTTPSKLCPSSSYSHSVLGKKTAVKSLASLSEKNTSKNDFGVATLPTTPKINDTIKSSSSVITVDSSSESDIVEVSDVSGDTSAALLRVQMPVASGLRKKVLLASTKKLAPINTMTTPRSPKTPATPLTSTSKPATSKQVHSSTSKVVKSPCLTVGTKKNPVIRRLDISTTKRPISPVIKIGDMPTIISGSNENKELSKITQHFADGGKNSNNLSDKPNESKSLATSTPYKSREQQTKPSTLEAGVELFSVTHSSNDEEISPSKNNEDVAKCVEDLNLQAIVDGGNDDLMQEIEKCLSTSDELKKQLQTTKIEEEIYIKNEEVSHSELKHSPSAIATEDQTTSNTSPSKSSLSAWILLKAINSVDKNKPKTQKEHDEKENQVVERITTPVRRRISLSVEERSIVTPDAVEETTIGVTKPRIIDKYNTENMGAIVVDRSDCIPVISEQPTKPQIEPILINRSNINLKNHLRLEALNNPMDEHESGIIDNGILNNAQDQDELNLSPLHCSDESFAEAVNSGINSEIQTNIEKNLESIKLEKKCKGKEKEASCKLVQVEPERINKNNIDEIETLDENFGQIELVDHNEAVFEVNTNSSALKDLKKNTCNVINTIETIDSSFEIITQNTEIRKMKHDKKVTMETEDRVREDVIEILHSSVDTATEDEAVKLKLSLVNYEPNHVDRIVSPQLFEEEPDAEDKETTIVRKTLTSQIINEKVSESNRLNDTFDINKELSIIQSEVLTPNEGYHADETGSVKKHQTSSDFKSQTNNLCDAETSNVFVLNQPDLFLPIEELVTEEVAEVQQPLTSDDILGENDQLTLNGSEEKEESLEPSYKMDALKSSTKSNIKQYNNTTTTALNLLPENVLKKDSVSITNELEKNGNPKETEDICLKLVNEQYDHDLQQETDRELISTTRNPKLQNQENNEFDGSQIEFERFEKNIVLVNSTPMLSSKQFPQNLKSNGQNTDEKICDNQIQLKEIPKKKKTTTSSDMQLLPIKESGVHVFSIAKTETHEVDKKENDKFITKKFDEDLNKPNNVTEVDIIQEIGYAKILDSDLCDSRNICVGGMEDLETTKEKGYSEMVECDELQTIKITHILTEITECTAEKVETIIKRPEICNQQTTEVLNLVPTNTEPKATDINKKGCTTMTQVEANKFMSESAEVDKSTFNESNQQDIVPVTVEKSLAGKSDKSHEENDTSENTSSASDIKSQKMQSMAKLNALLIESIETNEKRGDPGSLSNEYVKVQNVTSISNSTERGSRLHLEEHLLLPHNARTQTKNEIEYITQTSEEEMQEESEVHSDDIETHSLSRNYFKNEQKEQKAQAKSDPKNSNETNIATTEIEAANGKELSGSIDEGNIAIQEKHTRSDKEIVNNLLEAEKEHEIEDNVENFKNISQDSEMKRVSCEDNQNIYKDEEKSLMEKSTILSKSAKNHNILSDQVQLVKIQKKKTLTTEQKAKSEKPVDRDNMEKILSTMDAIEENGDHVEAQSIDTNKDVALGDATDYLPNLEQLDANTGGHIIYVSENYMEKMESFDQHPVNVQKIGLKANNGGGKNKAEIPVKTSEHCENHDKTQIVQPDEIKYDASSDINMDKEFYMKSKIEDEIKETSLVDQKSTTELKTVKTPEKFMDICIAQVQNVDQQTEGNGKAEVPVKTSEHSESSQETSLETHDNTKVVLPDEIEYDAPSVTAKKTGDNVVDKKLHMVGKNEDQIKETYLVEQKSTTELQTVKIPEKSINICVAQVQFVDQQTAGTDKAEVPVKTLEHSESSQETSLETHDDTQLVQPYENDCVASSGIAEKVADNNVYKELLIEGKIEYEIKETSLVEEKCTIELKTVKIPEKSINVCVAQVQNMEQQTEGNNKSEVPVKTSEDSESSQETSLETHDKTHLVLPDEIEYDALSEIAENTGDNVVDKKLHMEGKIEDEMKKTGSGLKSGGELKATEILEKSINIYVSQVDNKHLVLLDEIAYDAPSEIAEKTCDNVVDKKLSMERKINDEIQETSLVEVKSSDELKATKFSKKSIKYVGQGQKVDQQTEGNNKAELAVKTSEDSESCQKKSFDTHDNTQLVQQDKIEYDSPLEISEIIADKIVGKELHMEGEIEDEIKETSLGEQRNTGEVKTVTIPKKLIKICVGQVQNADQQTEGNDQLEVPVKTSEHSESSQETSFETHVNTQIVLPDKIEYGAPSVTAKKTGDNVVDKKLHMEGKNDQIKETYLVEQKSTTELQTVEIPETSINTYVAQVQNVEQQTEGNDKAEVPLKSLQHSENYQGTALETHDNNHIVQAHETEDDAFSGIAEKIADNNVDNKLHIKGKGGIKETTLFEQKSTSELKSFKIPKKKMNISIEQLQKLNEHSKGNDKSEAPLSASTSKSAGETTFKTQVNTHRVHPDKVVQTYLEEQKIPEKSINIHVDQFQKLDKAQNKEKRGNEILKMDSIEDGVQPDKMIPDEIFKKEIDTSDNVKNLIAAQEDKEKSYDIHSCIAQNLDRLHDDKFKKQRKPEHTSSDKTNKLDSIQNKTQAQKIRPNDISKSVNDISENVYHNLKTETNAPLKIPDKSDTDPSDEVFSKSSDISAHQEQHFESIRVARHIKELDKNNISQNDQQKLTVISIKEVQHQRVTQDDQQVQVQNLDSLQDDNHRKLREPQEIPIEFVDEISSDQVEKFNSIQIEKQTHKKKPLDLSTKLGNRVSSNFRHSLQINLNALQKNSDESTKVLSDGIAIKSLENSINRRKPLKTAQEIRQSVEPYNNEMIEKLYPISIDQEAHMSSTKDDESMDHQNPVQSAGSDQNEKIEKKSGEVFEISPDVFVAQSSKLDSIQSNVDTAKKKLQDTSEKLVNDTIQVLPMNTTRNDEQPENIESLVFSQALSHIAVDGVEHVCNTQDDQQTGDELPFYQNISDKYSDTDGKHHEVNFSKRQAKSRTYDDQKNEAKLKPEKTESETKNARGSRQNRYAKMKSGDELSKLLEDHIQIKADNTENKALSESIYVAKTKHVAAAEKSRELQAHTEIGVVDEKSESGGTRVKALLSKSICKSELYETEEEQKESAAIKDNELKVADPVIEKMPETSTESVQSTSKGQLEPLGEEIIESKDVTYAGSHRSLRRRAAVHSYEISSESEDDALHANNFKHARTSSFIEKIKVTRDTEAKLEAGTKDIMKLQYEHEKHTKEQITPISKKRAYRKAEAESDAESKTNLLEMHEFIQASTVEMSQKRPKAKLTTRTRRGATKNAKHDDDTSKYTVGADTVVLDSANKSDMMAEHEKPVKEPKTPISKKRTYRKAEAKVNSMLLNESDAESKQDTQLIIKTHLSEMNEFIQASTVEMSQKEPKDKQTIRTRRGARKNVKHDGDTSKYTAGADTAASDSGEKSEMLVDQHKKQVKEQKTPILKKRTCRKAEAKAKSTLFNESDPESTQDKQLIIKTHLSVMNEFVQASTVEMSQKEPKDKQTIRTRRGARKNVKHDGDTSKYTAGADTVASDSAEKSKMLADEHEKPVKEQKTPISKKRTYIKAEAKTKPTLLNESDPELKQDEQLTIKRHLSEMNESLQPLAVEMDKKGQRAKQTVRSRRGAKAKQDEDTSNYTIDAGNVTSETTEKSEERSEVQSEQEKLATEQKTPTPKKRIYRKAQVKANSTLLNKSDAKSTRDKQSISKERFLEFNESIEPLAGQTGQKENQTMRSRQGVTRTVKHDDATSKYAVHTDNVPEESTEKSEIEAGYRPASRRWAKKIAKTSEERELLKEGETKTMKVKKCTTTRKGTSVQEEKLNHENEALRDNGSKVTDTSTLQKLTQKPRGRKIATKGESDAPTNNDEIQLNSMPKKRGNLTKADLADLENKTTTAVNIPSGPSTSNKPRARRGKNVEEPETKSVAENVDETGNQPEEVVENIEENALKKARSGGHGKHIEADDLVVPQKRRKVVKVTVHEQVEERENPVRSTVEVEALQLEPTEVKKSARGRRAKQNDPMEVVFTTETRSKQTKTQKKESKKNELSVDNESNVNTNLDETAPKKTRGRRKKPVKDFEVVGMVKSVRTQRRKHVHFDEELSAETATKKVNTKAAEEVSGEAAVPPKKTRRH